MDPLTSSYISELAAALTASLLAGAGRVLRRRLEEPERHAALNVSYEAGVGFLLTEARELDSEHRDLLGDLLRRWIGDPGLSPEIGRQLEVLLHRGRLEAPQVEELRDLFEEAGYDPQTLPGFGFERAMALFAAGFSVVALQQPVLQGEILAANSQQQTELLIEHTTLLRMMLGALQKMSGSLEGNDRGGVEANSIEAGSVVSGVQIIYQVLGEGTRTKAGAALRRRYLERLRDSLQRLPLKTFGADIDVEEKVHLDNVFIELEVETMAEELGKEPGIEVPERGVRRDRVEYAKASDVVANGHRVVLLGGPGSGKSSLIKQLVSKIAERSEAQDGDSPVPVFVVLRELVEKLQELDLAGADSAKRRGRLAGAFRALVLEQLDLDCGLPEFGEELADALDSRGKTVLFLDGLDEVSAKVRQLVRETVSAVDERFRPEKIAVTCRTRSYEGEAVLPGFDRHTLRPLDLPRIEGFIASWFATLAAKGLLKNDEAERLRKELTEAVRPLQELAGNPMLLTTMALVHRAKGRLPDQRVKLYKEAVEILLQRWRQDWAFDQMGSTSELRTFLKDVGNALTLVEHMAFELHRLEAARGQDRPEEGAPTMDKFEALRVLYQEGGLKAGLGEDFLEYVDHVSGLFVGQGGADESLRYGFPHRTFQEYLAGCHIARLDSPAEEIADLAEEGDFWREPVLFALEDLVHSGRYSSVAFQIARHLEPEGNRKEGAAEERRNLWSAHAAALLGKQELAKLRGGGDYLERVAGWLPGLLGGELTVTERADAGRLLARLGDSRPEITIEGVELCFVPKGAFWLGSDKDSDPMAYDDEAPVERQEIAYDYWIGRFPVTQRQFADFVEEGGYGRGELWPEAQEAGRWEEGGFDGRDRPRDLGGTFSLPNHPLVGVSWYEAVAFCRWLSLRAGERGWLPEGWSVALPSELEWEKAARGGVEIPARVVRASWEGLGSPEVGKLQPHDDSRQRFPWGSEIDPGLHANLRESRVGSTSALGCFPAGRSPYGCEESSGNAWEWTRSLRERYPYPADEAGRRQREDLSASPEQPRVLRGGSFFNDARNARCSYRSSGLPGNAFNLIGFRVVLLPFSDL